VGRSAQRCRRPGLANWSSEFARREADGVIERGGRIKAEGGRIEMLSGRGPALLRRNGHKIATSRTKRLKV